MDKNETYKKINEVSEAFGIRDDEKTIFEIVTSGDINEKKLMLKSGSWGATEPWFGIDEANNLHTMVSIKSLSNLIQAYKRALKENFDLRLEKSIWQHVPVDFGDVWMVCMDEIKSIASENENSKNLDIDLDFVVDKVKKKYPNLFVDLKDFINESRNGL